MRHHPTGVPADEERVVLGRGGAGVHRREHRCDSAEQLHGGVDEVAVQVEQDAAALGGAGLLPPSVLGHRPPPLPAHLVAERLPHQPLGHHPRDRRLLGVVAPVLEDGERDPGCRGVPHDAGRRRRVDGQRLVDDAGQPGIHHGPHLLGVPAAGGRQHHEVEPGHREQLVETGHHLDSGDVGTGRRGPLRVAGRHRHHLAARLGEQGGVDVPPGEPVPGQRDACHARQPRGGLRARRAPAPGSPASSRSPAALGRPAGAAATRSAGRCRTRTRARAASAPRRCRAARRTPR